MEGMDIRRNLLWIDSLGGLAVGILVFSLRGWLSQWYQLPLSFVTVMAGANLLYGSYSLSLVLRNQRPRGMLYFLIAANLGWAVFCICCAVYFAKTASVFGILQLCGEGMYVGGLGLLEWKWREFLWTRQPAQ